MARFSKLLGGNRDVPQEEMFYIGSAAAASSNDYEHPILIIPNLASLANTPTNASGLLPTNDLYIRTLAIIPEAAVTGAATNNFLWGFRQWRGGSVLNQISTQNTAAITAGSVVVTPVTGTLMAGIQVGTVLHIAAGGGTAEDVIVTAISAANGTFTATFAFNHNANTAITGTYLAANWYNGSGVTEAAMTTHQFTPLANQFKPGDVLTFARVSYGTGLSGGSPNVAVMAEWVMLSNNQPLG
ncbi:MAG TPA: hypothetical protein VFA10_17800 [Ktedonobacteraceae bacterium]|nr:hypothetical protein [Ktedonobacteraceae bacterium]